MSDGLSADEDLFGALRGLVSGDAAPQWHDVWPLLDRMSAADRERYGPYAIGRITGPRVAPHRWLDEAARTGELERLRWCDGLQLSAPFDPETVTALLPRLEGWQELAHLRVGAHHHAGLFDAALALVEGRRLRSLDVFDLSREQDMRRVLLLAQRAGVRALGLQWAAEAGDALDELEWLASGALRRLTLSHYMRADEAAAQRMDDALLRLLVSPAAEGVQSLTLKGGLRLGHAQVQALGRLPLRELLVERAELRWDASAPALPALERLSFLGARATTEGLARTLTTSPGLRELTVRLVPRDAGTLRLPSLDAARSLRALDVAYISVTPSDLATALARCTTLRAHTLDVTTRSVPWPQTSTIEALTLICGDGALWGEGLSRVRWPRLRALSWSGRADDAPLSFTGWDRLGALRDVSLAAPIDATLLKETCGLSEASWQALLSAGLPLESLAMRHVHIEAPAIQEALAQPSLRHLRALRIGASTSQAHCRAILTWPGLPRLRRLELAGDLPDAPFAHLPEQALALDDLNLQLTRMDLQSAQAMLRCLRPGMLTSLTAPSLPHAGRDVLLRQLMTDPACRALRFLWVEDAEDSWEERGDEEMIQVWFEALSACACQNLEYIYGFLPEVRPAAALPWPEGKTWPAWLDMT